MSELTNYIKERIETIKFNEWRLVNWKIIAYDCVGELQAVLSKIEENPWHTETVSKVNPDGSFEVYEAWEDALQELNK